MTAVVDASVAIKWVIEEEHSTAARDLVVNELLAAPDLVFIECANVLRTKVRRGQLSASLAREALARIEGTPIRAIPARSHAVAAHVIAVELESSAYDALYLAVALAERATLMTADARFARLVQAHPSYAGSVRLLGA